jgi:Arc/MetJ-type ribon-helix-helix transcriptional regulator
MSKSAYVEFRGEMFWAFDVVLAVFLKHLVDVAAPGAIAGLPSSADLRPPSCGQPLNPNADRDIMSTEAHMSTNLPPELNRLIAQELALGHYRTEEELLTEAVQLLTQRNALREQIAAGTRQLDSGEYTDYDPQALRQRFDDLKSGKRFSTQRDS